MANYPVNVEVDFVDAAERISTKTFYLVQPFDDTANAGAGNMDEVLTAAAALRTNLEILSWAGIVEYRVYVVIGVASVANVSANNQVEAFTRMLDTGNNASYFTVPAWDDLVFDQDSNNLLSSAYNTAAEIVRALLRNPDTGNDQASVQWSQSRAHKSRGKKLS